MSRRRLAWSAFFLGALYSSLLTGLTEDLFGLERWIAFMRRHWISSSITLPFEYGGLVLALILTFFLFKATKD
jgi:hypothetical protein